MWGGEGIRKFGSIYYLYLSLISISCENPHGAYA